MQKFEKGFFVGAATAAHQVEGNNIHSDYWAQEQLPHTSFTEPSGIACDHYNRYEEDIRLLADAGLNAYRFSIGGRASSRRRASLTLPRSSITARSLPAARRTALNPL